jgi:hypothetical protein
MLNQTEDLIAIDYIKSFFRRRCPVTVGDLGIYQDVLTVKTNNVETSSLYYDVFVKIKAVAVYQNLIEIEVIDVFTINASNQNIAELLNANIPKYIHPRYIKWEIKPNC